MVNEPRDGARRPHAERGERAPGRGRNRPAPSLVMATLLGSLTVFMDEETGEVLDGPVSVSGIEYPDGGEVWAVPRPVGSARAMKGEAEERLYQQEVRAHGETEAKSRAAERERERAERSAAESVRRAKSRVRRVVRFFGLSLMVTLTFPGDGVHDYDLALRLVQDFIHDHGECIHLGGHYVAVPELHPRGHGWHWHVLVCRRLTKSELHALRAGWTSFLGRRGMEPSGGARWVRIDLKDWGSAGAAAGYASKYVGKTMEDGRLGKHRRRFLASQGAEVEIKRESAASLVEVQVALEALPGCVVRCIESDGGRPPIVWGCWD